MDQESVETPEETTVVEQSAEALEKSAEVLEQSAQLVEQLGVYGFLILDSLYLLAGGMLFIFLVHRAASRFLYPLLPNPSFLKILFGALYVLVLDITILLALRELGFDVTALGRLSILVILVGAVLVFFLLPFLPRLPFMLGHLVEINGVMGNVTAISSFHTTLRKFDGTVAFIPNALVLASRILNYSDTPSRRIEMKLSVNNDSDLEETVALFKRIMGDDPRVLDDPAPPVVYVIDADASGVNMMAFCWVDNADWFATRSDLWLKLVSVFNRDERLEMSLPQQEVHLAAIEAGGGPGGASD